MLTDITYTVHFFLQSQAWHEIECYTNIISSQILSPKNLNFQNKMEMVPGIVSRHSIEFEVQHTSWFCWYAVNFSFQKNFINAEEEFSICRLMDSPQFSSSQQERRASIL